MVDNNISLGKKLNQIFGKAYIKNLKDSINRRNFVTHRFENIELEYELFEAIEGTKYIKDNFVFDHGSFHIDYPASAGFWGNQMTTLLILMKAINNNEKCFMTFDDDVYFYNYQHLQKEDYDSIEQNLPNDWDVIIFGGLHEDIKNINTFTYWKVINKADCAGCHGVAINNSVYKDWLKILDDKKYFGDGTIAALLEMGKNVYHINPWVCVQNRCLYSDINKKHHKERI